MPLALRARGQLHHQVDQEEQRQRALRNRYNQEFHNFTKKVEEAAKNLEFDIPYRELGFYGVPPHNKSTCYIMPAVTALVELTALAMRHDCTLLLAWSLPEVRHELEL